MKSLKPTFLALGYLLSVGIVYGANSDSSIADSMNCDAGAQERLMRVRGLPEEPCIRVLLANDQETLDVEVIGSHNIYNPKNGKKIESSFITSSYTMAPTPDGLKWGQDFPGLFQMMIVPDDSRTPIKVNGIEYPGILLCYQVGSTLAAVNCVSLDDFTTALLSSTLLPSTDDTKETLAAYAIAFRTKGLWSAQHPKNSFWDMKASSVGYRGKSVMRQDKPFLDAVTVTKKLVLLSKNEGVLSQSLDQASLAKLFSSMPQAEVAKMAKNGKNAKEILEHFFPEGNLSVFQGQHKNVLSAKPN